MNLETITRHYFVAALWSSTDDEGEPLDGLYTIDDLSSKCAGDQSEEVRDFVETNRDALTQSGLSDEQIGHDFWLTRNGHGAGFWDRGLGAIGEALTQASKPYGDVYLFAGCDGYIHCD